MDRMKEKPARILVVDDLRENVTLLQRFLEPLEVETIPAYDGAQALAVIASEPPDVILLDLVMPDIDGLEVCRRLKSDQATRHIPVIIISGMSDVDVNAKAIEIGADDFLTKPFDAALLTARIRSSLRAKRVQDQLFEYQQRLECYNDTLEMHVRDRTKQVERTQQVALFSLARLAESRDNETGDHLERMRNYTREVALELLNWDKFRTIIDQAFVDEIYLSSPLHDIGKVGIPDSILLKPGKLTDEEFDIMKTHSIIGGDTLKAADIEAGMESFLAMGRDIAYSHHEKWDGSGYPAGLSGEEIPLASRIVAIGDVYDALTSKRPYKDAFSHDKSIGIIKEGRGTHFDPDVVDAFLERESSIVRIRETYQHTDGLTKLQELNRRLETTTSP